MYRATKVPLYLKGVVKLFDRIETTSRSHFVSCLFRSHGFQWKDFSDRHNTKNEIADEVQCPETIVRREEQPMNIVYIANEIQNKLCFGG